MSFEAILINTASVVAAAGLVEADYRRPLELQPEGGADRKFQVSGTPIAEVFPRLAISDNRRNAAVTVRVAYFRGGGNAGGGDRKSINELAGDEMETLAAMVTNPERYDSQNTGTRRISSPDWRKVIDGDRVEYWDLAVSVEWEEFQKAAAVA